MILKYITYSPVFDMSRQFRGFPNVPVRHRKILDKLARCSFCDQLCCCIEHCLIHERKHANAEDEKTGALLTKTHEWIKATESTLNSQVVKSEFPFFCVYCSIKIQDEKDLRQLLNNGPWCTLKKCHWMVPLAVYHEVNKENETRDNHMDFTQARGACNFPRLTPRKTPDRSLLRTALSNCLHSTLRTPVANTQGYAETVVVPLTSTPEEDRPQGEILQSNPSPTTPYIQTPKATPQIEPTEFSSTSPRNKPRIKTGSTRKVTFSCDNDIVKFKDRDDERVNGAGEGGEREEKECGSGRM